MTREELTEAILEAVIGSHEAGVAINTMYNQHPKLFKKINKWESGKRRRLQVMRKLRLSKDDDFDINDKAVSHSTRKAHKWLSKRKNPLNRTFQDRVKAVTRKPSKQVAKDAHYNMRSRMTY